MTTPSNVQTAKYKKFLAHPLKEKAIEYLNLIVSSARLELNDLGITWGVTVCTDSKSVLRVNVSNRYLADVISSMDRPEGLALMCVIGEPQILGPRSMRIRKGFDVVKDSKILTCTLGTDSTRLLSESRVRSALLAHARTSERNLPNPNWHNPLTTELIDTANASHPENSPTTLFSDTKDPNSKIVKHIAQMLFLISYDDTLSQDEEDRLIEDLNQVALDLCDSMTIKVIDVDANDIKISIELVSPISEPSSSAISDESRSSVEIAETKIREHMAMMLFSFFCDPDESDEQKNEAVDDANEIAQILFESMNVVVTKIQNDSTFTVSLQLVDPLKFVDDIDN